MINTELFNQYKEKNKDPYGNCAIICAEEVMRVMETEEIQFTNKTAERLITDAGKKTNADLTGFLAGCVAHIVTNVHSRGEEFRDNWNKGNGVEDSKGVANPAILKLK